MVLSRYLELRSLSPAHATDAVHTAPLKWICTQFEAVHELVAAMQSNMLGDLCEQDTLGRVYSTEQIYSIATGVGANAVAAVKSAGGKGLNSTYAKAEALARVCSGNRDALGKAVLDADHEHTFELLSYFDIPRSWEMDAEALWRWLSNKHGWEASTRSLRFFHPFLQPANLYPRLDSARISGQRITFGLGALRVVRKAHAITDTIESLSVVRVPIVASLLFDLGIIEISMPPFAEPHMPYHSQDFPQPLPGRIFTAIDKTIDLLHTKQYFPQPPGALPRNNLMIFLETEMKGEDLGWDAERMTGMKGQFDTTQRAKIPLKAILIDFAKELEAKCNRLGYKNPLEGRDLYEIFRTLKSESHTLSMAMGVNLGPRDGRIELTAFFGKDADGNTPFYWILSKFSSQAREALRKAVQEASAKGKMEDPYSIAKKFEKKEL